MKQRMKMRIRIHKAVNENVNPKSDEVGRPLSGLCDLQPAMPGYVKMLHWSNENERN